MRQYTLKPTPLASDHLLLMYKNPTERYAALADYFRQGLANGELCILAVPESAAEAATQLHRAGLDSHKAIRQNNLRIFGMVSAYLPRGTFASNTTLTNVVNYIIEAKAKDYNGVRTAGDMAWIYDHPEFLDDAIKYEDRIGQLQAITPGFTGLCMYPERPGAEAILAGVRRTHVSHIAPAAAA